MTRMLVGCSLAAVMAAAPSAQSRKAALAQARVAMRNGSPEKPRPGENTTIGLSATNAKLTKAQAKKVADMAHDGFARAMVPGDANVSLIGGLAAGVMADAILRGVRENTGRPNILAVRDLRRP
ncbi:MAG: hypothetical protein CK533_06730 [Acidobacterium sp.]|nr:hypothetical protein [Acidobacteriota bacterium]PHY10947.1 MAG: hypothetical protein CK533_06730 [Acidobacterium sp.]